MFRAPGSTLVQIFYMCMQSVQSLEKCYSRIFDFHFQIGETVVFVSQCRCHTFAMKRAHAVSR